MEYWVSASFIVQSWPAVTCLSERYLLLLLSRFYVQVISMTGVYFLYRNFIRIQREWLQEFATHEEFLLFSCSCPLLTLPQHCKGKQIPNLNSKPKPDRKTVVLSCEVYQEENKRTVASEDIFPLHLDLKISAGLVPGGFEFALNALSSPGWQVGSRRKVQADTLPTSSEQQVRRQSVCPLLDSSLDEVLRETPVTRPAVINEVGEWAFQSPNTPF